ncbi:MAG: GWxTD domain-containing protein [Thermoanaerobaculales bacterium]|nr:GWxTD domain-containing protein [Thermoanaerobaculales bacterium]
MQFKRVGIVLALVVFFAALVHPQISEDYRGWAEGPEGFLLTKKEVKAWSKISNDKEAKEFIALFWARRNPDPGAAFNQFRAQFDAMVKYCDEEYSYEGMRGALTDRGKVFILMGPPHHKQRRAPTEYITSASTATGQSGRGSDEVRAGANLWIYDPARMDPRFKAKGTRVPFTFYEERPNTNQFTLDRSHQDATMGMRALKKAPEIYFLHPDLEDVPKPVSVPNGTPATAAQLTAISAGEGSSSNEVLVIAELGVADAHHRPLWFQFGLPSESELIEKFAGRVLSSDGTDVLSTFQSAGTSMIGNGRRVYHLTFPLAEGSYRLELGGFSGNVLRFVENREVVIPGVGEETWLSNLWVGLNAEQLDSHLLGQAYTFDVWHLQSLDVNSVPHDSQLSYFGYLVNPEAVEGDSHHIRLKLTLRKDGRRLGQPLTMDLPVAQIVDGVFMYANSLDLSALPAGACELDFKIIVPGTEVVVERQVDLKILE